ncbi:hypothetical protein, partial [Shewanella algae]|uniref:hypothetical protein n=1 Tax=Shewanella algae TaxID=38313 RepID=UPI001AACFE2C
RQEVFTIFFRLSLKGLESRFLRPCHVFRVAAVPCQWERIIGSLNFCARAFYKKTAVFGLFAENLS